MDFSATYHHATYNPILLLILGMAGAVAVGAVRRWRGRPAGLTLAAVVTLLLVVISGEHIPLVASLAPKAVCFGDIAVIHVVAFVLPLLAGVLTFQWPSVKASV